MANEETELRPNEKVITPLGDGGGQIPPAHASTLRVSVYRLAGDEYTPEQIEAIHVFDVALMRAELVLLQRDVGGLGSVMTARRSRMVGMFERLSRHETGLARKLFTDIEAAYEDAVRLTGNSRHFGRRVGWRD